MTHPLLPIYAEAQGRRDAAATASTLAAGRHLIGGGVARVAKKKRKTKVTKCAE